MCTSSAARRGRRICSTRLLRLQDKIDQMTIASKPTEVRLKPEMVDNFKDQIRIAQLNAAANPEQLVQLAESPISVP